MNNIDCLILSSTVDFSTDLVCYELSLLDTKYLRLNRDKFSEYEISLNIDTNTLTCVVDGNMHCIEFGSLKSVYYRAPVFLRTQSKKTLTVEEQLTRNQWSSFLRNIIVMGKAKWINCPIKVFRAENKLYQLTVAKKNGMKIPETVLTNSEHLNLNCDVEYIVKSLDTALFYDMDNEQEMFTYSTVISGKELMNSRIHDAPVIIQEYLYPKIDCRVTFIDGKFFPFKIMRNGKGCDGDWRSYKGNAEYIPFTLPYNVEKSLLDVMKELGLNFGGIDLILKGNECYFVEVNPTGEWQWLEASTGICISKHIANALTNT